MSYLDSHWVDNSSSLSPILHRRDREEDELQRFQKRYLLKWLLASFHLVLRNRSVDVEREEEKERTSKIEDGSGEWERSKMLNDVC